MVGRKRLVTAAIVLAAACSSESAAIVFPDSIVFGGQTLNRASDWKRDGMQAIVYVPPGETLPRAATQVGVILSSTHTTAQALHTWVLEQSLRASGPPMYSSGEPGSVCRAAVSHLPDGPRTYISLQVCKTGVGRAVCVEADEAVDASEFNSCLGSNGCPQVCDMRWLQRREALDLLAADFITRR